MRLSDSRPMSGATSTAPSVAARRRSSSAALLPVSSANVRMRALRIAAPMALVGVVALSLLVVLIAAERASFLSPVSRPGYYPRWLAGPLAGLWPGLTSDNTTLARLASALIVGMYVLYALALAGARELPTRFVVGILVTLHVIFVLAPPLSYTDAFNYLNYGRLGAVHHINPYVTIPLLGPHADLSFQLSNWHRLLSPYGPLFTLFTYALAPLGVVASFWALKLVLAVASLATLALVWRCAQLLGRSPGASVVFVGCNPIVLVWGLGADHNDVLMVFFVMLALHALLRSPRHSRAAGAALVAAVFVKASAAVLLVVMPFVGERREFLRGAMQAGSLLGLASLLAFGLHAPDLSTQSSLVTAIGLPNLLGLAVGQGGESASVHALVETLLAIWICVAALLVQRRAGDWVGISALVLLALAASLSWAAPWYIVWLLPFAALARSRAIRGVALGYGVYLILAFMPSAATLADAIGLHPTATALGTRQRQTVEELVRQ